MVFVMQFLLGKVSLVMIFCVVKNFFVVVILLPFQLSTLLVLFDIVKMFQLNLRKDDFKRARKLWNFMSLEMNEL